MSTIEDDVGIDSNYPTLNFDDLNTNDDCNVSYESIQSDFDVFSEAQKQKKRRSSILKLISDKSNNIISNDKSNPKRSVAYKAVRVFKTTTVKDNKESTKATKSNVIQLSRNKRVNIPKQMKQLVNKSRNDHKLNSEELLCQKIEEERKNTQLEIERNNKLYQTIKRRGSCPELTTHVTTNPINKSTTVPKTPIKHLANRLGKKSCSITRKSESLIETKPLMNHLINGITQMKPFELQTEKRAKEKGLLDHKIENSVIIPAGELLQQFMNDTRSHHVPNNVGKTLTDPRTPNLLTSKRALTKSVSNNNNNNYNVENIPIFKAKKVNKRIFSSAGDLGVPKIPPKPLTEPQPFNLRIDERSNKRSSITMTKPLDNDDKYVFKALPMPDLNQMKGNHAIIEYKPLTIPISPKLNGNQRASSAPIRRQLPHHKIIEKEKEIKLNEYKKSLNRLVDLKLKLTNPIEFQFETKKRVEKRKNEKYEIEKYGIENKEIEKNIKPTSKTIKVDKKENTVVKEFNLKSVNRHIVAKENFQNQIEKNLIEKNKLTNFTARKLSKNSITMCPNTNLID